MSTNHSVRSRETPLAVGDWRRPRAGRATRRRADRATVKRSLEEIVVTATRRESSVLDIPYNISAISGTTLEEALVVDNWELMRNVAGASVVDRGYRNAGVINSIMIRGLNLDGSALGDYALNTVPTVSTYVNDTPIFANFILKDIERVEVLRGPQGTLYGSGSLGGTVRYIMREPDFEAFSGSG
ncbi:MAG: TonB-dependent receptor plug domain-containing protein [Woeseiaceae bacterium]|nr:TonB-dependent receptor plug domain-containing protein [Woeseiaceae bacterium]